MVHCVCARCEAMPFNATPCVTHPTLCRSCSLKHALPSSHSIDANMALQLPTMDLTRKLTSLSTYSSTDVHYYHPTLACTCTCTPLPLPFLHGPIPPSTNLPPIHLTARNLPSRTGQPSSLKPVSLPHPRIHSLSTRPAPGAASG